MSTSLAGVNWFGFAGAILMLMVAAVSLLQPWWQLTVGDGLLQANVSPVNTNFSFADKAFTIPFVWALNISSLLMFIAAGVAMLVYSFAPAKSYGKHLLGFSYMKPLYTLIFFIIGLIAATVIAQILAGITVPLTGATTATLPRNMTEGATVSVPITAAFQWPFWLAVVAAGLCIAARFYHKRISQAQSVSVITETPKA
ncbi:MAG: hypothetical protein N3E52_02750 [Candidatus Bathyarchaeota archaeon]|nr:hypothetical protein [Candidatus Bathyarchaeota archaeon]